MDGKSSAAAMCLMLCIYPCFGQNPTPTSAPVAAAPASPSPIDEIKKSVVFLQADCPKLDQKGEPEHDLHGDIVPDSHSGTAFLLGLSDPRLPSGQIFAYLVTNRHVAQPGIEDGKPCSPIAYYLRGDTRNPDKVGSYSVITKFPADFGWVFPSDPSVDLAIAPIRVDVDTLDVAIISASLLLTSEDVSKNKIEEGDPVLFAGLFVQFVGGSHSEPIVRSGKIAMMPREAVSTTLRHPGDIYLVDCHVFGGNSGSPMFVDLGGFRRGVVSSVYDYKLLGVVSGYVQESASFELQAVASYAGTVAANSGVAIAVPAQKVLDLLNDPRLVSERDNSVAISKKGSTH